MAVRAGYFDPTGTDTSGGLGRGARKVVKPARPSPPVKARTPQQVNKIRNDLTQGRIGGSSGGSTSRSTSSSTGSYSPGGGGLYSTGGSYPGADPISGVSEEDYLAGDATYQATLSALLKQLQNFETDITQQKANRKLDYDRALSDLGWIPGADGADGSWNYQDQLTAAGRSYQNLLNDYASRGMLNSTGYADAQSNLSRSLIDQFEGLETSNKQFIGDLDRQLAKTKDENTAAQQAARAEAIARRAAQMGFGV